MALNAKSRDCSLTKQDGKGYGFYLRIEKDELGHLIRLVECESSADKAGLRDGDRVLKVNGEFVDDLEHPKVVEMIQASGMSVTLTVLDEVSYLHSKKPPVDTAGNKTPSGEAKLPQPRLCYLVKNKDSFGFSLRTLKGTKGFYLDTLPADGAAAKAGVKESDRIVEVNGQNIEHYKYDDLVKLVKDSGDSVMFLLVDKETNTYFQQQMKKITAEEATLQLLPNPPKIVELYKGTDGYGFYLRQEKNHKGHFVVEIEQNSPAYEAGLKDYDRIIAVNGESMENFQHEQVVEAVRKGGNKTTLLISNKVTDEIYAKAGISPFMYLKSSKAPTPIKTETPKPTEIPKTKPAPEPTQPVAPTQKPTETPLAKPSSALAPNQPAVTSSPDPKHKPKLCRLTKGSSGFGFNLNAIKDVPGQYIKQVIKGGPADVGGIKDDDFLVEVNGVNVEKEAYEDVVMKIKEAGQNVTLLVVSQEGYEYFKVQNIPITSSMADPLPEANSLTSPSSNQKTPPSKARSAPEPVEMKTKTPEEELPNDDDDTAL